MSKVPFPHKQTTFTTNKTITRSLKLEKQTLVVLQVLYDNTCYNYAQRPKKHLQYK